MKQLAEFKRSCFERKRETVGKLDEDYMKSLLHYDPLTDYSLVNDAYEHIVKQSSDNPEKCRFFELFREYLQEPCNEYIGQIRRQIFEQLREDATCFGKEKWR